MLPSCDDKDGHYIVEPDDIIYRRCTFLIVTSQSCLSADFPLSDRTVRLLGQGTFGKVVEAIDTTNHKRVAIKIIRAVPKYRDASKIEVRVLQKLKERDPLNKKYVVRSQLCPKILYSRSTSKCIHLLHWFDYRNHICLVSELLGVCIYDFLKNNEFQPFPRRHIQDFARQLLGSVACMSSCFCQQLFLLTLLFDQFCMISV